MSYIFVDNYSHFFSLSQPLGKQLLIYSLSSLAHSPAPQDPGTQSLHLHPINSIPYIG